MKKSKILIVEDEAIVARTIERRLESLGYTISGIATSGKEALKLTEKKHPELVLMDIGLPGDMDGVEAAEEIRVRFRLPVIYLTAYGDESTLQRAKVTEPSGYLIKPFESSDLYRTIEMALYKHGIEKKLRDSEEKLKSVIASSPFPIIVVDPDGKITECNNAAIEIHGYSSNDELLGQNSFCLVAEKDIPKATANFEITKRKGIQKGIEYHLIRKDGDEFLAEVSASVIKNGSEDIVGLVAIYSDITERKRVEQEMKKKIMKYDLEDGNLYLVQEPTSTLSREAFKDLLKVGYKGQMITRTPQEKITGWKEHDFTHIWLAEKGKNAIAPNLKAIEKWLEEQEKGQAMLFERLDYLISKNGFKKTLAFVQTLNELAYMKNHIIILSVDPTVVRKNDVRQLEKETEEVEAIYKGKLPHDVLSLLRIVYEQNLMGMKPTYSNVGEELRISKPTTRKRVRRLVSAGYVLESVDGRSKVLELTEKGRNVFAK